MYKNQCVKSALIRIFSGLYFLTFGLNTERYAVSVCIQSKCGKIRTRKIPNMDSFYAVNMSSFDEAVVSISQRIYIPYFF